MTIKKFNLTLAGALFFGKKPGKWLPQFGIDLAFFSQEDATSDIIDHENVEENIPLSIKAAEFFVRRNTRVSAHFSKETFLRKDIYEYDPFIVRELIVHRDWSIFGQKIRLHLFSDRFELFSPGGLPNSLNIARAKAGVSYYRNPLITQWLKDYHFVERMGRGLQRIQRICKENNLQEPLFECENTFIKTTVFKNLF